MRSCPGYENAPAPEEPGTFFEEIDKAPAPGLKHIVGTIYIPDVSTKAHDREIVAEPVTLWSDYTFTYERKAKLITVNDPKIKTAYISG